MFVQIISRYIFIHNFFVIVKKHDNLKSPKNYIFTFFFVSEISIGSYCKIILGTIVFFIPDYLCSRIT